MKDRQPPPPSLQGSSPGPTDLTRRRHPLWLTLAGVFVGLLVWWFWPQQNYTPVTPPPSGAKAQGALPEDEKKVFAMYAGSDSCRACHVKEFEPWAKSNHGLAERALDPAMDRVAFDPPHPIVHATQKSEAHLKDGKEVMTTVGLDGKVADFPIARVIGNDPLRQFLVEAERGRLQTLELSWDPHKNEWFDVYGDEDRKPGEWGHWTGRGMTWNTMCAACHNTRLRKNYDATSDSFHTSMAQRTVSCEACHGPMRSHVDWQAQHKNTKGDPTIPKLSKDQMLDTCGTCHSRRAELTGDFAPGDSFHDHFALTVPDESDIYYPDGQVREEDYEFASFLNSRMHAAGVRCMDCHDPHSAKTILTGDALCMRCHTAPTPQFPKAPVIVPAAHTFHKAESLGARCISCHMPVTTYMQRHPRHDHGFTIPDPQLTKDFGIPNSCNRCHADKDATWALNFTQQWYGEKMNRPSQQRAVMFAKAKRGDDEARDALLAWLKGDDTPSWKASGSLLLTRWIAEPQVLEALRQELKHENPLVRASALHALAFGINSNNSPLRDWVRPLLKDPARNVRLVAAWILRDDVAPSSVPGRELIHMLQLNADQPTGRMQLAQYDFAHGLADEAMKQVRQAIAWDPNSSPFHHDLAIMLSNAHRSSEAITELEASIRLDPRQAVYYYELGLAWNEAGDVQKTAKALEEAVKLAPNMSRAWYNLGLARNGLGDTNGALDALLKGEAADPRDSGIPYARATILYKLGRNEEAKQAVIKVLQIEPQSQDAQHLFMQITRGEGRPAN